MKISELRIALLEIISIAHQKGTISIDDLKKIIDGAKRN